MSTREEAEIKNPDMADSEAKTAEDPAHSGIGEGSVESAAKRYWSRREDSEQTIKNHVMVALSLGLVPVPVFDFALLVGNQIKMVHGLGKIYEQSFPENRAKAIVISLVGGSLPVLGVLGLSALKVMPGIGSLGGSGSVAITGGILTYAVGRVFVRHFESGGTFIDLQMDKARDQFNQEIKRGREYVAKLRSKADTEKPEASPETTQST
jgi:uncharacterized protein (DUF697 family)